MFQTTGKCVTWLPRFFSYNEGLQMSLVGTKSHFQAGKISSNVIVQGLLYDYALTSYFKKYSYWFFRERGRKGDGKGRERGREGGRERERGEKKREKECKWKRWKGHLLHNPNGNQAHNLGICPDLELNQGPLNTQMMPGQGTP